MIALFFDTETTGFKSATYTPRLVQLAAVLQDTESKRILGELNMMVHTDGFPIPSDVAEIHGITNEVADAYGFELALVDTAFTRMLGVADRLVAHNIQFDLGIVNDNLPNAKMSINKLDLFCTMIQSTNLVGIAKSHAGGYKHPKLAEAYRYFFKKDFEGAHDAMVDVRACRDVYFAIKEA